MMENTANKPPAKVFCCGPVKAAIWLNAVVKDAQVVELPLIKISKSYKDNDSEEWKYTDRFYIEDLPKVAMVATEVYRCFRISAKEPEIQGQDNDDRPENDSNSS
jgi:hypothetical protein